MALNSQIVKVAKADKLLRLHNPSLLIKVVQMALLASMVQLDKIHN